MIKGLWFRWMPWKIIVRYAAMRHGFLDPINLLSQLQYFFEPSKLSEPVELLGAGLIVRAEQAIDRFSSRQSLSGYFHSQEGEWGSNGQVLKFGSAPTTFGGLPSTITSLLKTSEVIDVDIVFETE